MNKRAAAIAIILATVSHQALSNDYLLRVKTPDTEVIGVNDWIITETLGEWSNLGAPHQCDEASPVEKDVLYGEAFTQSQNCKQDQTQLVEVHKEHEITKQVETSSYLNSRTIDSVIDTEMVGSKIVRNMCVDILARNPGSSNGNYYVDYDGDGPNPQKLAYCNMSGGGWTLYDDFGTSSSLTAYNHSKITSKSTLLSAGYTTNNTTFNSTNYVVKSDYLAMFYGGETKGWAKKSMPSWVQGVKVKFGHYYSKSYAKVQLGSQSETITVGQTKTAYFTGTGTLTFSEYPTSIIWVDAVWVK